MSRKNKKSKWKKNACIICGATENLTKDHVVPKWFTMAIKFFGFRFRGANMESTPGYYKYQTLCGKCNVTKNGYMDYNDPYVRKYLKQFANNILDIIKIYEGDNNILTDDDKAQGEDRGIIPYAGGEIKEDQGGTYVGGGIRIVPNVSGGNENRRIDGIPSDKYIRDFHPAMGDEGGSVV